MKYNRYLPLIIPMLVWLAQEIFLSYPSLIYVVLVIILLLIFFALRQFTRSSGADERWWNFFILPALSSMAVIVYSTLQDSHWLIQFLFFLNLAVLYLYFRFAYYFLLQPLGYKIASIENVSQYTNFLIFFFFAAGLYGFQAFLNMPGWLIAFSVALLSILICYQLLWANKFNIRENTIYIFLPSLILAELAWAIAFLPLNNNIAGFTLAIFYYMIIGLMRQELLKTLDRSRTALYVGFGLASIVIIMLTARWF